MPTSRKKSVKPRVISSKVSFRGPIFRVVTEQVREPGGYVARRDIVRHPGSVVILAVESAGAVPRVLLERQYRHAAGGYLWELPAGKIDPGEAALAAAKRELREETGYSAARWSLALRFFVSPGFLDETMTVFLARDIRKGEATPEEDEFITVRLLPLPQAVHWAMNKTIQDAKTIASILWLARKLGG
jgi:ADP-ribose pyrophosphatase